MNKSERAEKEKCRNYGNKQNKQQPTAHGMIIPNNNNQPNNNQNQQRQQTKQTPTNQPLPMEKYPAKCIIFENWWFISHSNKFYSNIKLGLANYTCSCSARLIRTSWCPWSTAMFCIQLSYIIHTMIQHWACFPSPLTRRESLVASINKVNFPMKSSSSAAEKWEEWKHENLISYVIINLGATDQYLCGRKPSQPRQKAKLDL